MPSVKLDHTNFHYRLDGPEDRPLVVLSHALSVSGAMWRDQLPVLTQHFRVLSYDMRGHGQTDATGEDLTRGYTLEQMLSLIHISEPRDGLLSRMPSSA